MKTIIIYLTVLYLPLITVGQSQSWTRLDDFDGVGRKGAFSFVINNKGYVGSGISSNGEVLKDFWEYDPATDTWEQKQNASEIPRFDAVGFAIGNKGYMGTGEIGNPSTNSFVEANDFYEYDPTINQWRLRQAVGPSVRRSATAFVIGNKGYITTGYFGQYNYDNSLWEFDPVINQWNPKTPFNGGVREFAAGFSVNGKGYVGGGYYSNSNNALEYGYYNDLREYDPVTDSWVFKQTFPAGVLLDYAHGFSYNNKGYILGLDVSASSDVNFMEYNPTTNSFLAKQRHPSNSASTTAFNLCDYAYTATGSKSKEVWKYYLTDLTITGPSTVCTTGSNFTVNSVPPNSTITWSASPANLFTVASGTGSTAILNGTNTGRGQGTITFFISSPCGEAPLQVSKSFWVGKPSFLSALSGPTTLTVGTSGLYTTSPALGNAYDYSWKVPTGWRIISSSVSSTEIAARVEAGSTGLKTIELNATNSCGKSVAYIYVTGVSSGGGGGGGGGCGASISVSPNPAKKGDVTVNVIYPPDPCEPCPTCIMGVDYETETEYTLYDVNNMPVRSGKTSKQRVDVNGLSSGLYLLKVVLKDTVHNVRLAIE